MAAALLVMQMTRNSSLSGGDRECRFFHAWERGIGPGMPRRHCHKCGRREVKAEGKWVRETGTFLHDYEKFIEGYSRNIE